MSHILDFFGLSFTHRTGQKMSGHCSILIKVGLMRTLPLGGLGIANWKFSGRLLQASVGCCEENVHPKPELERFKRLPEEHVQKCQNSQKEMLNISEIKTK